MKTTKELAEQGKKEALKNYKEIENSEYYGDCYEVNYQFIFEEFNNKIDIAQAPLIAEIERLQKEPNEWNEVIRKYQKQIFDYVDMVDEMKNRIFLLEKAIKDIKYCTEDLYQTNRIESIRKILKSLRESDTILRGKVQRSAKKVSHSERKIARVSDRKNKTYDSLKRGLEDIKNGKIKKWKKTRKNKRTK